MAIATTTEKNSLATKYGTDALFAALYTTAPSGGAAGTEVTGGTYARQSLTWGAPANGVITATATFNVPAGVTLAGAGVHTAVTAGTFLDGGAISQAFATAGTYTLTLTFTQS